MQDEDGWGDGEGEEDDDDLEAIESDEEDDGDVGGETNEEEICRKDDNVGEGVEEDQDRKELVVAEENKEDEKTSPGFWPEIPASQPIVESHEDSYQEPVDPEPQPAIQDDKAAILIEDSPAKLKNIEEGVLEEHFQNRAAIDDQISEMTVKLNNAKKLLSSKHFG